MSVTGLTAKGGRRADEVLEAAIRCLGEDGYAGTSLARVAARAGVQKRMVLYYFGSRERLMAAALERVADRFLGDLEARVAGVEDPGALVDALLDVLLEQVSERHLIAAYFGLVAESANDDVLRATLDSLHARAEALAHRVLDHLEAHGRQLSAERGLLLLAANTAAHGLGLELLQRGLTPELERAIAFARAGAPLLLFD